MTNSLKPDLDKYKIVATFDPGATLQPSLIFKVLYFAFIICFAILFPVYFIAALIYFIIHEGIHWIVHWYLNGTFAKFGIGYIGPYVYSGGEYTARNNAIIRTIAPVTIVTLIIFIGLSMGWILFNPLIEFLLFINIGGSYTDIEMTIWYFKYPKEALCGDDGKKNYILLPKTVSSGVLK